MAEQVVHEWRITGEPGRGTYPHYEFTFRSGDERWPTPDLAETAAREFVEKMQGWDDGPHLSHRTVTYTDWEPIDGN